MVSWRLVCLTSLVLSDQSLAPSSREGGAALQRLGTEERGDPWPMAAEEEKLPYKRVWARGRAGGDLHKSLVWPL